MVHGIALWMHQRAVEVEAENEAVFGGGHAEEGTGTYAAKESGCKTAMTRQKAMTHSAHRTVS